MTTNFTGWSGGLFRIDGIPSRLIVAISEHDGLIKFPSPAHRAYALGIGPRPPSAFDLLPDEQDVRL